MEDVNEHAVLGGAGGADEDDGGLSFDHLLLDESLSDLERVGRYALSPVALQRLVHVKLLGETALAVGCVPALAQAAPLLRG